VSLPSKERLDSKAIFVPSREYVVIVSVLPISHLFALRTPRTSVRRVAYSGIRSPIVHARKYKLHSKRVDSINRNYRHDGVHTSAFFLVANNQIADYGPNCSRHAIGKSFNPIYVFP
jgi:hypothetical protein